MRSFEFDDGTLAGFMDRAGRVLADRGLESYVRLRLDGDELVVHFRWMGSSELRYRITENESGFRAEFSGEKVSPFHAPFRQRFEERFESVVGSVGARIV